MSSNKLVVGGKFGKESFNILAKLEKQLEFQSNVIAAICEAAGISQDSSRSVGEIVQIVKDHKEAYDLARAPKHNEPI